MTALILALLTQGSGDPFEDGFSVGVHARLLDAYGEAGAGMGFVYVFWLAAEACWTGEDDDDDVVDDSPARPRVCSRCGYGSCRCSRASERPSTPKPEDPKPRVRDLLKQK